MAFPLLVTAQPIVGIAVSGLWQGLLLLGTVALLLRALPTGSASTRATLWAAAFGLAVLVPFVHLQTTIAGSPTGASLHLGPATEAAIVALWLLLSATRATQLLREALRLRRIDRTSTPFAAPTHLHPLLTVGRRTLELRSSTAVDSPCVLGFLRPRLLLPTHATLSAADLHAIILHEREHLLRHDDWTNLLQRLALVLFPLNPALALIDRRLGAERELACDAAVVAHTAEPLRYAGILTRLAEQRLHLRSVALSLSSWARRSDLTRRVETLLRPAVTISPSRSRFAAGTVVVALCAGSAALARAPQFVSFANPDPAVAAVNTPTFPTTTLLPPHAIPAAFHPGTAHAVLTSATLPAAAAPIRHRNHTHRTTTLTSAPERFRTALAAPAAPRAVLTRATAAAIASRPVAARAILFTNDLPSYAAVPFAGGWLVIQL